MKIISVNDVNTRNEFLSFPARLYKNDPHYIRPLDKDIEAVFDPNKNKAFRFGICERWLCVNEQGDTVGKFATFINEKYKEAQPTGGIGFIDFIDDYSVSKCIFDFCNSWFQERKMEAMDGPINFGERDKWWGLLIDGYLEPLYNMNYNYPYYKDHFEKYGFEIYFNQLCFGRIIHKELSDGFIASHARISKMKGFSTRRMTKDKLDQFAEDFCIIYNKAWASHLGNKQMELSVAKKMFQTMKPVINEHVSWFVYYNNEPIAMWINLPDLNQWFKYLNGKFGLIQKLKFLYYKSKNQNNKLVGLVFGIVPEWQKKGVDGYMIIEGTEHFKKHTNFTDYEMQWIGDFNPKMISIAKNLETEVTRTLATYRFLFDRDKEFIRHPMH